MSDGFTIDLSFNHDILYLLLDSVLSMCVQNIAVVDIGLPTIKMTYFQVAYD